MSRYDGKGFVTFTTEDGLVDNQVQCILEDRAGHLWFGTTQGVSRYEAHPSDGAHRPVGEQFVTFTTEDGLCSNWVESIFEDREGNLWFGTSGGVSRYEAHPSDGARRSYGADRPVGEQFVTFTTQDGLGSNWVSGILEDREGHLWFGTSGGGVSRYDADRPAGERFVTFTTEDGLVDNHVKNFLEDREGHLWLGTYGGGVSRYDGLVFQRLSRKDGLTHDAIHEILQDRDGEFWIATEGGVTRYRPRHTPPAIRLTDVIADRPSTYGLHIAGSVARLDGVFRKTGHMGAVVTDIAVCTRTPLFLFPSKEPHRWQIVRIFSCSCATIIVSMR